MIHLNLWWVYKLVGLLLWFVILLVLGMVLFYLIEDYLDD
jgi:hypothetical protein